MIEQIALELINDNPYQARLTYHKKDIDDLAHSIKTHGLLQVPPGRRIDGKVELGFGHLRKRAFVKLAKKDPEKWSKMPVDIRDLTDNQMALFALEENLKRRDITPLETARAVDKYLNSFLEKTETELAEYLNMTQGNISHMRRVLRLPEQVLEKIDEGRISFTQARELIVLEKLDNAKELMLTAIRSIKSEKIPYGHPNTVEGMQQGVHDVVGNRCRPLDKMWQGYRWSLLFDTRAAGCLECEHMIRTHPSKSVTAHYCLNPDCWEGKQDEHREKAAAEAKAKMEADILRQAADSLATATKTITQVIAPSTDRQIKRKPTPAVVNETGVALPTPCNLCAKADSCNRTLFHVATDGSGRLVCEEMVLVAPEKIKIARPVIPEDVLALVKEKAGTRAEVLDLNDICISDSYRRQIKTGYALLKGGWGDDLQHVDDPEECTERCTHGFHYGFDSKSDKGEVYFICTDVKCLARKKSAFTRKRNANGQAQKKAEVAAIKEAIAQTVMLDRPRIKLILLAQMDGLHTQRYYYERTDVKKPEVWLWERLSAGTPAIERERQGLFKRIDKLTDEELARLVVEFMFYYLTDKGDIGAYQVKAAEPLKWMGVAIQLKPDGDKNGNSNMPT